MARPEGWLLILLIVGFILLSAKWHRPSPATIRAQPNAKPTPPTAQTACPRGLSRLSRRPTGPPARIDTSEAIFSG